MAKKGKFEYMSSNEWLGDPTTHFMKSGDAFRSPDNAKQEELAKLLPRIANGVKVEYDIGYDIPDKIRASTAWRSTTSAKWLHASQPTKVAASSRNCRSPSPTSTFS